jgi:hypothetical protein
VRSVRIGERTKFQSLIGVDSPVCTGTAIALMVIGVMGGT